MGCASDHDRSRRPVGGRGNAGQPVKRDRQAKPTPRRRAETGGAPARSGVRPGSSRPVDGLSGAPGPRREASYPAYRERAYRKRDGRGHAARGCSGQRHGNQGHDARAYNGHRNGGRGPATGRDYRGCTPDRYGGQGRNHRRNDGRAVSYPPRRRPQPQRMGQRPGVRYARRQPYGAARGGGALDRIVRALRSVPVPYYAVLACVLVFVLIVPRAIARNVEAAAEAAAREAAEQEAAAAEAKAKAKVAAEKEAARGARVRAHACGVR